MATGIVFDIKEFALSDGPGIRTTVFMKGCPLRCAWCHNPEGLRREPELYRATGACVDCGLCRRPCAHPDCAPYGRCLHTCPRGLLRVSGRQWESRALAEHLLRGAALFESAGGGVTVSGGEPLLQAAFVAELFDALGGVHRALETSGYAEKETFLSVAKRCELVLFDLKLADPDAHFRYTGVSNERILANAEALKASGIPHIFRIPLIPNITDTEENLAALAAVAGESPVELLSYNALAPAKYAGVGMTYPDFIDPSAANPPNLSLFVNATLQK